MLKVTNPYSGQLLGELSLQSEREIEIHIARAAKLKTPLLLHERIAILNRVKALLIERRKEFIRTAVEEGGKPWSDTAVEVDRAAQGVGSAIHTLATQAGERVPMGMTPASEGRIAITTPEPCGLVLAYSAFNHPLNMIIHQVIPAVATGCPILIKPALATPISCQKLVELLYEAGLPPEWCQMILCDNATAEALVKDPRIAFFSFIGSAPVGWELRSLLPPGARCALEHGGAAPVVVHEDADRTAMIPLLTKGGFYHAGQVCVSVQRIFAPEAHARELANELATAASQLVVGDPLNPKTDVGPLIRKSSLERVDHWIREAGTPLAGGHPLEDNCYAPTVLLDPPLDARISCEELFGPAICVYSTKSRDEAIARANALPFAFQAAIFGERLDEILDTVRRIEARSVIVNDHSAFRVDWMPFGAAKHSGLGTGGIPYAMSDLWQQKLIVLR